MPIAKTLITTYVCNFCGRGDSHTHGTGSGLAVDYFIERQGWAHVGPDTVACDRCKILPDVAAAIAGKPSTAAVL